MSTTQTTTVLEGGYIRLDDKLYENGDLRAYFGQTVDVISTANEIPTVMANDDRRLTLSPIFVTTALKTARNITLAAANNSRNKMGLILGDSGNGKTVATYYLAYTIPSCIRLCAWDGISPLVLLKTLLKKLQPEEGISRGTSQDVMTQLLPQVWGRIFVIDETNHLSRHHFEKLRNLVDEGCCTIIFVGTSLMLQSFENPRYSIYLEQAHRRIGGRQIYLNGALSVEILQEKLSMFFDPKSLNKPILEAFRKYNWGHLDEVIQQSLRRMEKLNQNLTIALIKAAAKETRAEVIKV